MNTFMSMMEKSLCNEDVNADDVQAFVTVIDVSEIIGAHIKKKPEIG